MCTAFVVNDTTALSAAHCTSAYSLGISLVFPEYFIVYNSNGENTRLVVKAHYMMKHVDILIIKGDFKKFNKTPLHSSTFELRNGDDLYACGFAGGYAPATCTVGEYRGTQDFMGSMDAYLAKGMSGGPVINRDGKAVGINSAKGGPLSFFGILFGNFKDK